LTLSTKSLVPFCVGFFAMVTVAGLSLTSAPLNFDEGATLSVATRSPGEIWRLSDHVDAVIAPYYLMLHVFVTVLGEADWVLRLPSLLAMSLGAGVVAEIGRRINGVATGVVSGVICAAVPSFTLLANTARPYALAFLFATLSSLLLLDALRTPTWWRWAGYGAAVLLTGVFHLVALAVLAGHAAIWVAAWRIDRERRHWRGVPAVLAALAALTPLIWAGSGQRSRQLHWVQEPTWRTVAALPGDVVLSEPAGYLLLGLALVAYFALAARPYLELLALAFVPAAAVLAVSLVAPVWVPRYGHFLIAPLAVLAAATITAERVRAAATVASGRVLAVAAPRLARVGAIAAVLVLVALPAHDRVRSHRESPDTRAMAWLIYHHAAPQDVIVYTNEFAWSIRPTLTHYLNALDWGGRLRPPDVLLERSAAQNSTLKAVEHSVLTGKLDGANRIWLIGLAAGSYGTPQDPLALPGGKIVYLREHYQVERTWTPQAGRLALLVPRPSRG
jgi:mannosyltransferase